MRVQELENRWSTDQLATGVGLPGWLRILADNHFQVSPAYLHRLAWITGLSLPTTVIGAVESLLNAGKIRDQEVDPAPLILLGHWRSGTTHLHNVLGRDPEHTFCTVYQAVFPDTFLTTGTIGPKLLANALPATRTYDHVAHGWFEAAEDEIALFKLTGGLSFYGALMFPDRFYDYEKYVDFKGATEAERQRFRNALMLMVKKLMLDSGGKRVVLKSCPHTARVPLLLELFPDAKFVFIHRHPARVFASMMHMRSKVDWENFMHRPDQAFVGERREQTALLGARVFERYLEDRALIPEGNLIELSYDAFCGTEIETAHRVYEAFDLQTWDGYEAKLKAYLDGLAGFKRNVLALDDELLDFVEDRWSMAYQAWDYRREPGL